MTPPKQPKKRDYQQHGLNTLKKALALVGSVEEWPAELQEVSAALEAKRAKMTKEQGGDAVITEVERDAIDAKLQLTVLRNWAWDFIKRMPCPVNQVKRKPFPIVESFIEFVEAESEAGVRLTTLREKRPKPEPVSLSEYLHGNGKATSSGKGQTTKDSMPHASPSPVLAEVHSTGGSDSNQDANQTMPVHQEAP